jgi:prepilin-type N-terminal cleavage/methylation domain-containing protein
MPPIRIRTGFTLIELLVVIAIIAMLAAILFPVFAKAREKARQTSCMNNQRQLAIGIAIYAQDHEDVLPAYESVWADSNAVAGVLRCQTAGKRVSVAYVYNAGVAGKALGDRDEIPNPAGVWLTADGTAADGVRAPRHNDQPIQSYVDGHVAFGAIVRGTGGTVVDLGGYRIHTFTSNGTFTATTGKRGGKVDVLVVAGGGGGGNGDNGSGGGGGGGAGGVIYKTEFIVLPGANSVTIGAGGTSQRSGANSIFGSLTAFGGGNGAFGYNGGWSGIPSSGGSGGGAHRTTTGGAGTQPGSASGGYGNAGGSGSGNGFINGGCGGGGAGSAGASVNNSNPGGAGGAGYQADISGTMKGYGGGGGGGSHAGAAVGTATDGGGVGGANGAAGTAGTANTGGGGGGGGQGGSGGAGGAGGSGIVIVRYEYP